jgi:predicted nuclease of predicted toxin-antitoxin system
MIRLAGDENLSNRIARGLLRVKPDLDFVYVQRMGLASATDPVVLNWAASEERVLLSHDFETMPRYAYARMVDGLPMTGLIMIRRSVPVGRAIEELLLILECSADDELVGRVIYLPI